MHCKKVRRVHGVGEDVGCAHPGTVIGTWHSKGQGPDSLALFGLCLTNMENPTYFKQGINNPLLYFGKIIRAALWKMVWEGWRSTISSLLQVCK